MTTLIAGGAPGAPTASAPSNISNTGMTVSFTPGVSDAANATQGYRLYTPGQTSHRIQVGPTIRSFAVTGLTAGTAYSWIVRAYNTVNGVITESENSNTVSATTTGTVVVEPTGIRNYYGLCTHTNYRNSPQYGNDTLSRTKALAARPLYMRDRLANQPADQAALWKTYTTNGIKGFHATVGAYPDAKTDAYKADAWARILESRAELVHVTGVNEPDGHTNIGTWLAPVVAWQKWLWETVKGDSRTAHIRVGLGSIRGANTNGLAEMRTYINAADGYFEFVDLHCYPGPKTAAEIKQVIDGRILWAHGRPMVFSEYGGSTANMTQAQQALVCTTGLEYLAAKKIMCIIYEQWDDPDPGGLDLQSNFGIYESTGVDKQAVVALRNLVG